MNQSTNSYQLGSFGETDLTLYTVIFFIISAAYFLSSDKRHALLGFIPFGILVCDTQRLVVLGLDFPPMRILVVLGFLRLFLRNEYVKIQLNLLDYLIISFSVVSIFNHTLLTGSFGGFVKQLGESFQLLGLYFFFRIFLTNLKEFLFIIKIFASTTIILAVFMAIENNTAYNWLSYLGANPNPTIREARVRSMGSFQHAILAGSYAAAIFPMLIPFFWQNYRTRIFATITILSCIFMIFFSASSGPVFALIAALISWSMWAFRNYVKQIFISGIFITFILHIVMQQPVWHLISRVTAVGGSASYHRYRLIDAFINNFGDWWLVGTLDNYSWGWGLHDSTNHFIGIGVSSGLFPMLLFIAILFVILKTTNKSRKLTELKNSNIKFLFWGIFASFLVHIASFISVFYFDQINILFYFQMAFVASCLSHLNKYKSASKKISNIYEHIKLKSSISHY